MKETISVNSIHKITESLDIVKTVSEYLNLKRAGKNFKALCPFHEENTPSFIVNPEKQIFHCFGCGIGGDSIKFLMSIENMSFPEAMELASQKTGIPFTAGKYSKKNSEEAQCIYKANRFAFEKYQSYLFSPRGKAALDYLYSRRLDEKDIRFFGIGLAPGSQGYVASLAGKKENEDIKYFIKAGLVKDNGFSDVFRNRIMFPIYDFRGEIAGFGGRALDDKTMPKYLNTAENPVFSKGRLLYGINWARESIKTQGFAILVEGYFDVIKLHVKGIKNTVAPMGTSLSGTQLGFLKRFTENILLLFDSDEAGMRASLRNLETILSKGFNAKICILPPGFDPDKFLDDYGEGAFRETLSKSKDSLEFLFDYYSGRFGTDTPKGKAAVAREMMRYLNLVPDEIEKAEHIKVLGNKLNVEVEILKKYGYATVEKTPAPQEQKLSVKQLSQNSAENLLIHLVLSDKKCWERLVECEKDLTPKIGAVLRASKDLLSRGVELNPANLILEIQQEDSLRDIGSWLADIALKEEMNFEQERKEIIFNDCLKKINKLCICEKLDAVKKEMKIRKDDEPQYSKQLEMLQTLLVELKKE